MVALQKHMARLFQTGIGGEVHIAVAIREWLSVFPMEHKTDLKNDSGGIYPPEYIKTN
jgi:hypothetical protein